MLIATSMSRDEQPRPRDHCRWIKQSHGRFTGAEAATCIIYVSQISNLTSRHSSTALINNVRLAADRVALQCLRDRSRFSATKEHFACTSSPFKMCGCTLYDSPTCGHSWLSMSQPCGFLSDLLSCPNRQTYQTLIAPPLACPRCNGGFADRETIEMVQGPWGCNQLIRSHLGGSHAIPGSWGNISLGMNNWIGSPGLGMGMNVGMNMVANPAVMSSQAMIPMGGYGYDYRLTGPYGPRPAICNGYDTFGGGMFMDAGFLNYDDGYGYGGYGGYIGCRRSGHKSRSKYVYRHSSKPATNCTVM